MKNYFWTNEEIEAFWMGIDLLFGVVDYEAIQLYIEWQLKSLAKRIECDYKNLEWEFKMENRKAYCTLRGLFREKAEWSCKNSEFLRVLLKFKRPLIKDSVYKPVVEVSEDSVNQLSKMFVTIIDGFVPEDQRDTYKKYFNIADAQN